MCILPALCPQPFYSEITESISIGSLPLSGDVQFLHNHNVCGVINMCWEYNGPVEEYRRFGITQLHLPTADLTEPSLVDVLRAVEFLRNVRSTHRNGRVFIHCKGIVSCISFAAYLLS